MSVVESSSRRERFSVMACESEVTAAFEYLS
ncbi:MAG: hypothetical protein UV23_C0023G0010 [Candidatus Nomurabacteria bacterium GW2011_GWF1_42_40]|nr:MAG: hypothetical protein UV23_C0023G0010 [Candidatus Nomurabacteria bacterium GW2011_GWF1_42_40]